HCHPCTISGCDTQLVVFACALSMQPSLLILVDAFCRLTSAATVMLLERLQQWALDRHSLIVLFERNLFPFLTRCQRVW
ncbi:cobalt ABC transporter ATP-binding protein, partial [Salmonella enterica subsp. enterica serovar Typhimurium]